MADLRDATARPRHAHLPVRRPHLPAGLRPELQSVRLVCRFLRWVRRVSIPSSAACGKIGDAYVAALHRYARPTGSRWCTSRRGRTRRRSPPAARRGGDRGRGRQGGAHRHRLGEGVGVAVVAGQGQVSAPRNSLAEPFFRHVIP